MPVDEPVAKAVDKAVDEPVGVPVDTAPAVRTGLAAVLLVLSLLTRWDEVGNGGDSPWILVALLVALVACAVPYLLRPGVLDRRLPPGQLDAVVALLIAPVVLVAVITMIRGLAQDRGVGIGVAFAAAAAVLLAQTRGAGPPTDGSTVGWRTVAAALYLFGALWGLAGVAVLVGAASVGNELELTSTTAAWALAAPLLGLSAAIGWIGVQLFRRDAPAWAGGLALSACLVVAFVALRGPGGTGPGRGVGGWSVDAALGGLAVLSVAGATASCAPGVRDRLSTPAGGGLAWIQAALGVVTVAAIGGVGLLLQAALTVASIDAIDGTEQPTLIWFLALSAVAVAALVAARVVLGRQTGRGRAATAGLMAGVVLLAIVGYAVTEASVGFLGLMVYFLAPLTVMAMVLLPPSVRERYGPLLAGHPEAASESDDGGRDTGDRSPGGSPWSVPPP